MKSSPRMGKLLYSMLCSLDGYVEDAEGNFDWAAPDEEVHSFVNELERPVGTHLYGRRMYETMTFWEVGGGADTDQPSPESEFAEIWRGADKVVYSRTLSDVSTARTRLERDFDAEALRTLKRTTDSDLSIGGPGIASQALAAGLVDELHLFIVPVAVGGGKPVLPLGLRLALELTDHRGFGNGTLYLRYRVGR
ncbi:MAG TPA: dihydrofolate reductase family protein [Solirubrobacterales bacterium]|nr:dihydrofolate reductase family protein [Solirubrobacterales bacterium]